MKSGSCLSCLHAGFLLRPASSGLAQIGGDLRGLDNGPERRGDTVDPKNRRLPVAARRLLRRRLLLIYPVANRHTERLLPRFDHVPCRVLIKKFDGRSARAEVNGPHWPGVFPLRRFHDY